MIFRIGIIRLRAAGKPLVALGVIFQHSPLVLISSKEAGVQTIHDLAGKRIMIQDGSADLVAMLKAEHVPIDSIEWVPHSFSYEPLLRGEVDAFSGYITNEPYSLKQEGYTPLIFSPQSVGVGFYGDALFTTEAHIRKNPAQVQAFLEASLRGWEYALEHPDAIIDLILNEYSSEKSRAELEFEAEESRKLIRNDLVQLGHMHPRRWQHIAEILDSEGMLEGPVDVAPMLYKYEKPFPTALVIQIVAVAALALTLLTLFARHQTRAKNRLLKEIRRREQGDELLRTREKEYAELFENAPLAFIVWDTELHIKEWNKAAETLFGWSREEVLGKNATEFLVPGSAAPKVEQGKKALHENTTHFQVNENYTKDGRIIWCEWSNVARKNVDGDTIEFHSIAHDVTHSIQQKAQLETERSQAIEANAAKDTLLAQTSHEIRNPLNAILGFAEFISEESENPDTVEMATIIMNGARSMLSLLNNLLDTSKIDAGKMELNWEPIDLGAHVRKESGIFSQVIKAAGVDYTIITAPNLPPIKTDPQRLTQVLNNLIGNAAKFTAQGRITVETRDAGPEFVEIRIQDTGIGMDPATLDAMFEPYTQAKHKSHQHYKGTGLGLPLTKKLVELLQGSLSVESELQQGSTFTARLPKQPK